MSNVLNIIDEKIKKMVDLLQQYKKEEEELLESIPCDIIDDDIFDYLNEIKDNYLSDVDEISQTLKDLVFRDC